MRFDSKENIDYFVSHAETKTLNEWAEYFGCKRDTIGAWKKKYSVQTKKPPQHASSEETKKKISEKRKAWLAQNPDKHPWKNRDKFKSEPCEKAKEFLRSLGVSFVAEFSPQIDGRYFSIDIALPDKMIALEINGNQHYERNGQLKPYYQERHDLLTSHGWNVFEIHYSACFNLEKWSEFSKQIIETPSVNSFDYFNYQPRKKKEKRWQNKCECGKMKSFKAIRCRSCRSKMPRKPRKRSGIPIQTPTGNGSLEESSDMRFHHRDKKRREMRGFCSCGEKKHEYSKQCRSCWDEDNVGTWPSQEEVSKLVWEIPSQQLAKQFGVSDVALAKFCKRYGISKPPRGYWAKKLFNKL